MFKLISLFITSIVVFFLTPTDTNRLDLLTAGEAPGTLQFVGNAGGDNVFTVEKWAFTKLENLNQPTEIIVEAIMDTRSISCSWQEMVDNVKKKKDYFFIDKFPEASLSINGATDLGNGKYQAEAQLTLKGISKPVLLDFSLSDSAPYQVKATGTIVRQEFKFKGKGPKNEVPVMVDAVLEMTNIENN